MLKAAVPELVDLSLEEQAAAVREILQRVRTFGLVRGLRGVEQNPETSYVLAGDTGDVIETATHSVVARIPNLLNTRKFVEIDWQGGRPTASSGRQGVGLLR